MRSPLQLYRFQMVDHVLWYVREGLDPSFVDVHLCSNEVEMATDHDWTVERSKADLPFDVLVHGDLVMSLRADQEFELELLGRPIEFGEYVKVLPITTFGDPRYPWKLDEFFRMRDHELWKIADSFLLGEEKP